MIAMEVLTIAYSTPMGLLIMVLVSPGNKRVDHAVETWTQSSKNNVIPLVNVDILMVIALCLELVKNEAPQINIKPHHNKINPRQKPLVKHQVIVMILAIVYSTPMDPLTVAHVKLGCKREDHVEVTWPHSSKNNVILHVIVD